MYAIITTDGTALTFDSLMGIDIADESSVIDEPVELGSFASYNKVASPLQIRVALGFSGSDAEFGERLTELVGLVTGAAYYESLSVEALRYSRSAEQGYYLVDLNLKEVRQVETTVTTTEYSRPKVKNASSASTVDTGKTEGTDEERASMLYKGTYGSGS